MLFSLLDLDKDDYITFNDFHVTFSREQKAHPDLTPREIILQFITANELIKPKEPEPISEEPSDEETVHRAVMIEGVPDFVRKNDKFILELEELIFKEYQPLQTEIVGDCLEIIFAYDIKREDMKIMEKELKELLSEFCT
eukprot:UN03812